MRYKWFLAPLLALFLSSVWAQSAGIPSVFSTINDAFSTTNDERLQRLSTLPVDGVLQAKFLQTNAQYPLDIALFGNSISLPVVPGDIILSGRSAFNFAVPGTSFQTSVTLLERLVKEGHEIKLAIIQVDSFEAINVEPAPWPRGPRRLGLFYMRVISALMDPQVFVGEILHMGWRTVKSEAVIFSEYFNVQKSWAYVAYRFPKLFPPMHVADIPYSADGSLPRAEGTVPRTRELLHAHGNMLPAFFALDLGRVAQLSAKIDRIVLVEMPLEPTSAAFYGANPTQRATRYRGVFLSTCSRFALECHIAQTTGDPKRPNFWADEMHPSGQWLAAYLRHIVAGEGLTRRAVRH